jgi:drug/metabolite transporter (DMT)-like permease
MRAHRIPAGLRYMAAAAFFFSLMSLLVKVAGQRLPTQQVVLARSVVMLALTWIALRRAGVPALGDRRGLLLLRGLLGFGALTCFYYGIIHLPLADATVIQYTNPVFAGLLAIPLLGERPGWREVASVLVSLAGVLLIAQPSLVFGAGAARLPAFAVAVALGGALFSGSAYVVVRKLGATEHHLTIILYFSVISVIGSLPPTMLAAVMPTPVEWLVLLGIGVTTQFGQVFLTRGLALERAGRATAVGYLQIVFAGLWGLVFFREVPGPWALAGAALVVGGTLALARPQRRLPPPPPPPPTPGV